MKTFAIRLNESIAYHLSDKHKAILKEWYEQESSPNKTFAEYYNALLRENIRFHVTEMIETALKDRLCLELSYRDGVEDEEEYKRLRSCFEADFSMPFAYTNGAGFKSDNTIKETVKLYLDSIFEIVKDSRTLLSMICADVVYMNHSYYMAYIKHFKYTR